MALCDTPEALLIARSLRAGGGKRRGPMNQRKPKPWMGHERIFIWAATIVTFLMVAGAITYRAML
jgi:hypothetical protein